MVTEMLEGLQTEVITSLLLKIQSCITPNNTPTGYAKGHEIAKLIEEFLDQNPVLLKQLNEANNAILKASDVNSSNKAVINFYTKDQTIIGQVFNVASYMLLLHVPILQVRYNLHQNISNQVSADCKTCILSVKAAKQTQQQLLPWEISLRVHPCIPYPEIGEMFETTDPKLQEALERLSSTKNNSKQYWPFMFLEAADIMNQTYKILNTISAALLLQILACKHPNIMQITVYISGFTGDQERDCRIVLLDSPQNRHIYANNNDLHCTTYGAIDSKKITISFSAKDVMQNINALLSTSTDIKIFAKASAPQTSQAQQARPKIMIQPIECLPQKYQPQYECIDNKRQSDNINTEDVAQDSHQVKSSDNAIATKNTFQTINLLDSTPIIKQMLPGKQSEVPAIPINSLSFELQNEKTAAGTVCKTNNPNTATYLDHNNAVPIAKTPENQFPSTTKSCQPSNNISSKDKPNLKTKLKTAANTITNAGRQMVRNFNNLFDTKTLNKQNKKQEPKLVQPLLNNTCKTQFAPNAPRVEQIPEQQFHYCCQHNAAPQRPKTTSMLTMQKNPVLPTNPDISPIKDIISTPKTVTQNTPTPKPLEPKFNNCIYGNSLIGLIKQYFWTLLTKICSFFRLSRAEQYCKNSFLLQNAAIQQPEGQAPATENTKTLATLLTSVQASIPNASTKSQNTLSHNSNTIEHKPSTMTTNSNRAKATFALSKDLETETKNPTTIDKAQAITNTVLRAFG